MRQCCPSRQVRWLDILFVLLSPDTCSSSNQAQAIRLDPESGMNSPRIVLFFHISLEQMKTTASNPQSAPYSPGRLASSQIHVT